MPSLVLTSNRQPDNLKAFVLNFSKFAAALLGKEETYISIDYRYNESLSFAGSFEPAFLLVVTALGGNLTPENCDTYSAAIFNFIKEHLFVPDDRGYITFQDPGMEHVGYKSTTFATLFPA